MISSRNCRLASLFPGNINRNTLTSRPLWMFHERPENTLKPFGCVDILLSSMISEEAYASFWNLLHAVHPRPVRIGVLISLGLFGTSLPHDSQATARRAIDGMVLLVKEKPTRSHIAGHVGVVGLMITAWATRDQNAAPASAPMTFGQNIPEAGVSFRPTSRRSSPP